MPIFETSSMTRIEKILAAIDPRKGQGAEIGPLMAPVVTRDMGEIYYIDRASTEELVQWYEINPEVDTTKIVSVDFVWGERSLSQCTAGRKFDYCVASHVIEHVPDLISWLQEVSSILVDGGILSLVVPDKRYTFDCLRDTSTMVDVADAYLRKLRKPSIRQIFDHFSHFTDVDAASLWRGEIDIDRLNPKTGAEHVLNMCENLLIDDKYIDTHCWVFTPHSFIKVISEISELGLFCFELVHFFHTDENAIEFILSLRKLPESLSSEERHARLQESIAALPKELGFDCKEKIDSDVSASLLASINAEKAGLQSRLDLMESSSSWRITAPLRALANTVRRGFGPLS